MVEPRARGGRSCSAVVVVVVLAVKGGLSWLLRRFAFMAVASSRVAFRGRCVVAASSVRFSSILPQRPDDKVRRRLLGRRPALLRELRADVVVGCAPAVVAEVLLLLPAPFHVVRGVCTSALQREQVVAGRLVGLSWALRR